VALSHYCCRTTL